MGGRGGRGWWYAMVMVLYGNRVKEAVRHVKRKVFSVASRKELRVIDVLKLHMSTREEFH
jgi:hypothetical protein